MCVCLEKQVDIVSVQCSRYEECFIDNAETLQVTDVYKRQVQE